MTPDEQDRLRIVAPDGGTVAYFGCLQGLWTEEQYLKLTNAHNRLFELTDGRLDILPMPTKRHQAISRYVFLALYPFVRSLGGDLFYAPLRLRVREGKFREPDLLLLRDANDPRGRDDYWDGADLVVEIVSPDDPLRDTRDKRVDYAEARIAEYWIVNPIDETVTVLALDGESYSEHGVFGRGERADSKCLPGFALEVIAVFDAE